MILTIPLALVLGVIVLLLHRDPTLKPSQTVVIGLFGFTLADPTAGRPVSAALGWLLHRFFHP